MEKDKNLVLTRWSPTINLLNDNYVRFGIGRASRVAPLFKIEKTEVQVSFDLTKRIDLRAANKSIGKLNFGGWF
jgi:hypothetical protein